MASHKLETSALLPAPIEQVFNFFSRAENLEKLTPKSLRFEILTPLPIEMKPGAIIEYRLRLLGIPFRWQTEIVAWEPGVRFVDVQRKGPYAKWIHEHTFKSQGSSTLMEDRLEYAVPGGFLGDIINKLFVRRQVAQIFAFREAQIRTIDFDAQDHVPLESPAEWDSNAH